MSKKFIFEGKCDFDKEDSGAALISHIEQVGKKEDDDSGGLFVRIQSWDQTCNHLDAKTLNGKAVRVTVEVLEDANVKYPDIPAECHSDDHVIEVKFNAGRWLVETSDTQILNLLKCGCGGDYASDEVAQYMSDYNDEVAWMFSYLDIAGNRPRTRGVIGFECHVQIKPLMLWLKQNKPEIYKKAISDENMPHLLADVMNDEKGSL